MEPKAGTAPTNSSSRKLTLMGEEAMRALHQGRLTQEMRVDLISHLKDFAVLSLEQQEAQGKGSTARVGINESAHVPSLG